MRSLEDILNGLPKMSEDEIKLSKLLFSLYHTGEFGHTRSPLTDRIVISLRGHEARIMELATQLAKVAHPSMADEIGAVTGFLATRPVESAWKSVGELWAEKALVHEGEVNPYILWAKASLELQKHYSDVVFDHAYHPREDGPPRPAIHGTGVNIVSVNGAILTVLMEANLLDGDFFDPTDYLATHQDKDGWVMCLRDG
jgi:hypothetical protein